MRIGAVLGLLTAASVLGLAGCRSTGASTLPHAAAVPAPVTEPAPNPEPERPVFPWEPSPVSGLPLPGPGGAPRPSGLEADLAVLDWAGYEGAVSYTFDDSQPSQIQHWPEIKATGVRATWYLAMTYGSGSAYEAAWKDVLAAGHELGDHTVHHLHVSELAGVYPGLSDEEAAAKELDDCDNYIERVIGQDGVWTMAYPYGDASWEPFLGDRYLFARTVSLGKVSPDSGLDPLLLPTYMVRAGDTRAVFNAKIDAAAAARCWQTLLFHSLTPTASNWYAGVRIEEVVASIEHGKAGGRVWLDSVVNVGSYWIGSRLIRSAVPTQRGGTETWSWKLPRNFPPGKYIRVRIGGGTLSQGGTDLPWNDHGFYEVALDPQSLDWRP